MKTTLNHESVNTCAEHSGYLNVRQCPFNTIRVIAHAAKNKTEGYNYFQQYSNLQQSICGRCKLYDQVLRGNLDTLTSLLSEV